MTGDGFGYKSLGAGVDDAGGPTFGERVGMIITETEAIEYLTNDGDLAVPCSRYGWSSSSCAPVAWEAASIIARELGEPLTFESLDYVMGLVVNDHDDIEYLLTNYGGES
jgi:hypothetical protein